MRAVVVGLVADELGFCASLSLRQGRYGPDLVRESYARPAVEFRSAQAARIPLDVEHRQVVGQVRHLSHEPGSGLWAVAVVDQLERLPDVTGWFYSPMTTARGNVIGSDVVLDALALTTDPGSVGLPRVVILPGELRQLAHGDAYEHKLRSYAPMVRQLIADAAANTVGTTVIHGRDGDVSTPTIEQRSARSRSAPVWSAPPLPTVHGAPGSAQRPAERRTAPAVGPTRYRIIDGERVPIEYYPGGKVLSVR